jgi:hypothetical protein
LGETCACSIDEARGKASGHGFSAIVTGYSFLAHLFFRCLSDPMLTFRAHRPALLSRCNFLAGKEPALKA